MEIKKIQNLFKQYINALVIHPSMKAASIAD